MPGGLMGKLPKLLSSGRRVYLLQRKTGKMGASLGKTTGWIHRLTLKQRNVIMINAVTYNKINDDGFLLFTARDPIMSYLSDSSKVRSGPGVSASKNFKYQNTNTKQITMIEIQKSKQLAFDLMH